jgi:hypothetical protein
MENTKEVISDKMAFSIGGLVMCTQKTARRPVRWSVVRVPGKPE